MMTQSQNPLSRVAVLYVYRARYIQRCGVFDGQISLPQTGLEIALDMWQSLNEPNEQDPSPAQWNPLAA
ncbi:hypothetical protein KIN20_026184 [Parelaphostrongylus tenuis]|uniref:Uncharacterized protein n=1 Tax=Parelaphostrongylus tenuis TaxID=148309 RepID=A0AAD5QXI5_PARTN|nr:hypothetical protein KIN20_026184 [Parelaphostrongylus tenuis]